MQVNRILRKLSKSFEWQTLYHQAKEINLKLFQNDSDLTDLQLKFLAYLMMYSGIFTDISMNEVDEFVLTDQIYEDAYIYYKRHGDKKEAIKNEKNQVSQKHPKGLKTQKIKGDRDEMVFI